MFRVPSSLVRPLPPLPDRFGVRGSQQLGRDLRTVLRDTFRGARFQVGPSSLGHLRPDLALPAYAGLAPADGMAPIMNLFDRTAGGQHYSQRVTKHAQRDFRGGRLSYDEHDGTDFVCPVGTPLVAGPAGDDVYVIASAAGSPKHPAWYTNLLANPTVTVEVPGDTFTATARPADEPQRSELYAAMVERMPQFADYQKDNPRTIPVVVLERA